VLARSITATLQKKTTPPTGETAQDAGLIGEWTYPCQLSKEHPKWWQWKILDFEGNKLTTIISQFADTSVIKISLIKILDYGTKVL
jgi:hypothetical protein